MTTPTTHNMMLHAGPFADIASGVKKSELRLHDAKRRLLAVGDHIVFTSRADESQALAVRITLLIPYVSWRELYHGHKDEYGHFEEEAFVNSFPYYSPIEEAENGVVYIGIERI